MIEHPRARCNITLDEFVYVQGKRAILNGLQLEKKHYKEIGDQESVNECQIEWLDEFNELWNFKDALKRSDEYHEERKRR